MDSPASPVLIPLPQAASPDACCTEAEVQRLVHEFYAAARQDEMLGPIFEQAVEDWDDHLRRLVDFWSAQLRGTRRFMGAPLARHLNLPRLDKPMFERWLMLFRQTTAAIGNPAMQAEADSRAARIAEHFHNHYQQHHGR